MFFFQPLDCSAVALSPTSYHGGRQITVKMGTVKKKVNTVDSEEENEMELLD
ncbi:hypothetical protein Scep_021866 [Stephania cephalantha]|uniref:Uncharacterized protein n=1 Tax=Stephania cephalantha TaxID=152367 RepID=A0AAP0F6X5_9MAGN